ncbi:B-cell receptor CD22 isoform X2 [Parambassis ranga]|uniref:B-cell receptor CD22 isoform X2 n=1 Tax=Parambassis ranga TaxID=210632 RepID=A0A6P7K0M3_9TELE|nr:B-cell receptor CD22-like isoform X2 [Parambassis ranga]
MCGGMAQNLWLLLALALKGILAGDWSVDLPSSPICAVIGSSVFLPCSYDYPQGSNETREEGRLSAQGEEGEQGQEYEVLSEMWCLEDSKCVTPRYVFHSAGIFPDPSYQSRVQYLGQPGSKNCSLMISDLKQSDSGTYIFYLITSHPTEKMPAQRGVQLLVADTSSAVSVLASPSRDITEGVSLRLACCSPAVSSRASYSWHKNTSPKHSRQVWIISEVTAAESGSYYCQIQREDKVQNSTMLVIDVQYAPRDTAVTVSTVEALQKELPVTLTCSSDANPPVHTFAWYQGAACLPTADKNFHQGRRTVATPTGGGPTVRSANITAEEYGQHCCLARNNQGSQIYTVTIRQSRAIPPLSTGRKVVLLGVSFGILLAIIAIGAFLIRRGRKSSRHQSYVLTETTATEP